MKQQQGFTKLSLSGFRDWLKDIRAGRTITKIQQHHTYVPGYALFTGTNHFNT